MRGDVGGALDLYETAFERRPDGRLVYKSNQLHARAPAPAIESAYRKPWAAEQLANSSQQVLDS